MNGLGLHPGTMRLLRYQTAARFSRTLRRLRGRRRLALSILALLLGCVWIGHAAAGLLFREPADPQRLQAWIPLGLLTYALWHVLKTACHAPVEPFEWTPAEREMLGAAPLWRSELVMYRLTMVGMAAAAKAGCFCLVMLPDVRVWWMCLPAMLLALLLIDLLRMAIGIFAYGLSRRAFLQFRAAVLIVAATCVLSAVVSTLCQPHVATGSSMPKVLIIAKQFLASLAELRTTWIGTVAELPFRVFGRLIVAPAFSPSLVGYLLAAAAMVVGMVGAVVWLDDHFARRRLAAERARFSGLLANSTRQRRSQRGAARPVRVPYRLWGAGSLAWRQMRGVVHYRTSVSVALIVPALLSCVVLVHPQATLSVVAELVATLVFYSFLLLPTALGFDFHRDLDRLGVLKSLPISPAAITVGQLAVPVLITTVFQAAVLLMVFALRPFHPGLLAMALVVLLPTNVLIFAMENLIFLLYPYRLGQEGIGVFVRSILTFTAKGILFGIGLGMTIAWALISKRLSFHLTAATDRTGEAVIFTAGMWLLTVAFALATIGLLASVYRRFDPSQDTPAAS